MDSNGRVSQHGLHASGRHDDLRVTPLDLVGERDEDSKLDFILIIRNAEKSTARQLLLINLIIINLKNHDKISPKNFGWSIVMSVLKINSTLHKDLHVFDNGEY